MQNSLKIPEGWSVKKLGDIGKICMCKRIFKEQTHHCGEVPFYKIGTFGEKADAFISWELFAEYKQKYSYPKIGDILISCSGTIGRTVIFNGQPSYFQDSNIVWINNDENILLNQYLFYLYNIIKWKSTESSTIARLYNDNIKNTKIYFPPLPEQEKIAGILSCWDDGIEKLLALIEKKKIQKKALMQQLLTGKHRLKGFSTPWHEVRLGELIKSKKILLEKGKNLTAEQLKKGDIPVIAGGKTVPYYHASYTHDKPSITISASGAYAGYVWFHKEKIWASDCNVIQGSDSADTVFWGYILQNQQDKIYRLQTGGAQPHVYSSDIKSLIVPELDLAEQKAIAEILSKADEEIELLNKKLEAFKQEKKALMQQLLTGKIRVKVN